MNNRPNKTPMPVKYWSRAGLMLTDWCNARCACCYACCGPEGKTWMDANDALRIWADLLHASPHGCRVHLTGGELVARFDWLVDLCRRALRVGLAPLESVETNGYWADTDEETRRRLTALSEAGMQRLAISADPFHQQFVPIGRVRRLACLAEEVLGADRLRVRWQDWLEEGVDVRALGNHAREALFADWTARGRDRLTGRAFRGLDAHLPMRPPEAFDNAPCREVLLRGRHVHIAPTGEVWPATCVGIVVGNALTTGVGDIWRSLHNHRDTLPLLATLCERGPVGLIPSASRVGWRPRDVGYAGKCQLCYELRRYLFHAMADDSDKPVSLIPPDVRHWHDRPEGGEQKQPHAEAVGAPEQRPLTRPSLRCHSTRPTSPEGRGVRAPEERGGEERRMLRVDACRKELGPAGVYA